MFCTRKMKCHLIHLIWLIVKAKLIKLHFYLRWLCEAAEFLKLGKCNLLHGVQRALQNEL